MMLNRSCKISISTKRWAVSLAGLLVCGTAVANVHVRWESCNGPTGTTSEAITGLPDGTVLTGTTHGVYLLPPGQTTWVPTGLDHGTVRSLLSASDRSLFVDLFQQSGDFTQLNVLVSTDGGGTWSDTELPRHGAPVHLAETTSGVVWTGSEDGLFRWDDGARSWVEVIVVEPGDHAAALVESVVADGAGGLFAAIWICRAYEQDTYGVWRSLDDGETWHMVLASDSSVAELAVGSDGQVLAGGDADPDSGLGAALLSTDSGNTWTDVTCPAGSGGSGCLGLDRASKVAVLPDGSLVAGDALLGFEPDGALWRTDGASGSWRQVDAWIGAVTAMYWQDENTAWLSRPGHIVRTTDGGASFQRHTDGLSHTSVGALVRTGSAIFATTRYAGLQRSRDSGQTWEIMATGVSSHRDAAVDTDGAILVATEKGVLRSTDQGDTWSVVPGTDDLSWSSVVTVANETLCGLCADGTTRCTTDGGTSWSTGTPGGWYKQELIAHPDGVLFLRIVTASNGGGLLRSADRGITWDEVLGTVNGLDAVAIGSDGVIFAAERRPCALWQNCDGSIVWSDDAGSTWHGSPTVIPQVTALEVHRWWGLLAGVSLGPPLLSRDKGVSWMSFGEVAGCIPGEDQGIEGHATVFLYSGNLLFAGTADSGVFRSEPSFPARRFSDRRP
jgi:photosystem II stability/assembly factor-like uncharacterized protein